VVATAENLAGGLTAAVVDGGEVVTDGTEVCVLNVRLEYALTPSSQRIKSVIRRYNIECSVNVCIALH